MMFASRSASVRAGGGADPNDAGCCGSAGSSCGPTGEVDETFGAALYDAHEQGELPAEAVAASASAAATRLAVAELRAGERVLDLGSGGGIDVLLSARRVGPTGFAYGVDMTDEMLDARPRERGQGRRDERRVPQGHHRGHPAARRRRSTWSSPTA